MHALTEDDIRGSIVNGSTDDLRVMTLPGSFLLAEWDHLDFYAWRDPKSRGRGYMIAEIDGEARGIVLRAADGHSRARSAMCNICHTMQPGDQVTMFTARRAGEAGEHGDSVGTYICADLSCHENVRLAPPLAPSEVRGSVDLRIDGTARRATAFVARVLETAGTRR